MTLCSQHRSLESHHCPGKASFEAGVKRENHVYAGPTAASLFPDRDSDKAKINELIESRKPKPTNILQTQFRVGDAAKNNTNAFNKFKKFLLLQKTSKKPKFFSKKPNKVVEVATLRKSAKGDTKITATNRVYIWCVFVDSKDAGEDDYLAKLDVAKERKPIYISSAWSIGRALDSIADYMKIANHNNSTRDSAERLNIFMVNESSEEPVLVDNSGKVLKAFRNGDTVYLVKGTI